MKKRLLSLVLCLVMVFSLFPAFGMNAAAVNGDVTVTGDDISGLDLSAVKTAGSTSYMDRTTASWNVSGTSISGSIHAESTQSTTLTIKNDTGSPNVLTFDYECTFPSDGISTTYTVVIDGGAEININSTNKTGSFRKELGIDDSITVVLKASTKTTSIQLTNVSISGGGTNPDDPIQPGEIQDGSFIYTPAQNGLHVGDDIDLSKTYYVQVNGQWKEVSISKDTYYTKELNDGAAHNDDVATAAVYGWTPITGDGMYFMKDAESAAVHNTFLPVQSETGTLPYRSYSNKLVAGKDDSSGMIINPEEGIAVWAKKDGSAIIPSTAYVVANGEYKQVFYANKGSDFHYNMFLAYQNGTSYVPLNLGANEHNGHSKYDGDGSAPLVMMGDDYYTYNNKPLFGYGGKGYYTGTYLKQNSHSGKTSLFFMDGSTKTWLKLQAPGTTTTEAEKTVAGYDDMVVYTGPLYRFQSLQRATYFDYDGIDPVVSRLQGDTLTSLTLYTRRISGQQALVDNDPDDGPEGTFGTLVDTTNNFKGNLFIQKKLYRQDDGTYNIKLESWATGDMTQSGKGKMDIVMVVDLSHSMHLKTDGNNHYQLVDQNGNEKFRIEAVIPAIQDFIDTLYTANQKGADFRLSIVSFAGDTSNVYVFNGTNKTAGGSATATDYRNSLKRVDATGRTQLKSSLTIDPFTDPQGNDTRPLSGLTLAEKVLNARTDAEGRDSAVIFFTDGFPGNTTVSMSKYADPALKKAHDLRTGSNKATIYSVGVFDFDDTKYKMNYKYGNVDNDIGTYTVDSYMRHISSQYPEGYVDTYKNVKGVDYPLTDLESGEVVYMPTDGPTENTDQQYYYKVQSGVGTTGSLEALKKAFADIASSIAKTDVPVTKSSILRDVINPDDFALPSISPSKVTVEVVPAEAINSLKQIKWNYADKRNARDTQSGTGWEGWQPVMLSEKSAAGAGSILSGVEVKNFDYQKWFSAPASGDTAAQLGKKLVVRITGLMPKHGGEIYSNSDAGILHETKDSTAANPQYEMYLSVESPFDKIHDRTYVVDFNAKMNLAESGYLASGSDNFVSNITGRSQIKGVNGDFNKNSGTVTYQFDRDQISGTEYNDYSYDGADTALVFGQYYDNGTRADADKKAVSDITTKQRVNGEEIDQTVSKAWQVVNMIPASSIYFDDFNGQAAPTVTVGDGSGYNAGVTATPVESDWAKGQHTFAFTGTGIDIYCTTDNTAGFAQCMVDGDGNTIQSMKNYSETKRYNVPTFSFRGLEYGKHSVTINILTNSHYKFDGVRIYGPVEDQALYNDTTEQYAVYANIREALVNDGNQDKTKRVSLSDEYALTGALFVDDSAKMKQIQTVMDPETHQPVQEDGKDKMITVYADQFAAYTANSPKHEIYLAPSGTEITRYNVDEQGVQTESTEVTQGGQSVAFQLTDTALTGTHIWVGLSAPDATATGGTVTINGTPVTVDNALDQYYPVTTNGTNNTVMITNTGSTMISITNLKITGSKAIYDAANGIGATNLSAPNEFASVLSLEDAESMIFAPITMQTVKIAANDGVDPDAEPTTEPSPEPTPDPTVEPTEQPAQNWLSQLISNFVSMLFRSIARLFGN